MADKKSRKETSKIKQRQWQAHIQAWGKSGLLQNEYCRQHKLSSSQFCYWKKKLKQAKKSTVNFVPVPACTSVQEPGMPSNNSSGLTIILDGGVRIGLDNHFSTRALADAISVLKP
ncbi:MAG: hypothetical protein KAI39_06445 [Desulfobulbaceae bacterium]|nr:hypothetical protein [Desulfobulbaceae bacterium]